MVILVIFVFEDYIYNKKKTIRENCPINSVHN